MPARQPSPPTVVVVGSVNADLLLDVELLPRPGETVAAHTSAEARGGKGANQAAVAAGLGARTVLVAAVGDDADGRDALADLAAGGVDTTGVQVSSAQTGKACVMRDAAGENMIVLVPGANATLGAQHVRAAFGRLDDVDDAVVVASLEIPDDAVLAAAVAAAARGWRFVLNPAPARRLPPELLDLVSVLTPNETEAPALGPASVADLLAAGVGAVLVTRGARGVDVHVGETCTRVPATSVEVVDTVGAGDALTAALAVALASGQPLEDAVRLGSAAAGLAVSGQGARGNPITMPAVVRLMQDSGWQAPGPAATAR